MTGNVIKLQHSQTVPGVTVYQKDALNRDSKVQRTRSLLSILTILRHGNLNHYSFLFEINEYELGVISPRTKTHRGSDT